MKDPQATILKKFLLFSCNPPKQNWSIANAHVNKIYVQLLTFMSMQRANKSIHPLFFTNVPFFLFYIYNIGTQELKPWVSITSLQ